MHLIQFQIFLMLLVFGFWILASPAPVLAQSTNSCQVDITKLQTKYGFSNVSTSEGWKSKIEGNLEAFKKIGQLSSELSPKAGLLDPILAVWWAFTETAPPYNSYTYSNCLDSNRDVNNNCVRTSSGSWQLGFGQQFSYYTLLPQAMEAAYRAKADDTKKTEEIISAVLRNANQEVEKNLEKLKDRSLEKLIQDFRGGDREAQYLLSVLHRDPKLSVYLLSSSLKADMEGAGSTNWQAITARWSSYYTNNWLNFSQAFLAIAKAWNENCQNFSASGSSSPDSTDSRGINNSSFEEAAVKKQKDGTLPEFSKIDENLGIIPGFFSSIAQQFLGFFFGSGTLKQANLPQELLPGEDVGVIEKIKSFLGAAEEVGIYNAGAPEVPLPDGVPVRIGPVPIPGTEDSNSQEKFFEKSFFPEKVTPVTGQ